MLRDPDDGQGEHGHRVALSRRRCRQAAPVQRSVVEPRDGSTRSTSTAQRFLVVRRNGVRSTNLAWKDTAVIPAGETVDLLLEMSNPGRWMMHCHIAEHLGDGDDGRVHVSSDVALHPVSGSILDASNCISSSGCYRCCSPSRAQAPRRASSPAAPAIRYRQRARRRAHARARHRRHRDAGEGWSDDHHPRREDRGRRPPRAVQVPQGARTIDLAGKTVIPGIIGLHDHMYYGGMRVHGRELPATLPLGWRHDHSHDRERRLVSGAEPQATQRLAQDRLGRRSS